MKKKNIEISTGQCLLSCQLVFNNYYFVKIQCEFRWHSDDGNRRDNIERLAIIHLTGF